MSHHTPSSTGTAAAAVPMVFLDIETLCQGWPDPDGRPRRMARELAADRLLSDAGTRLGGSSVRIG